MYIYIYILVYGFHKVNDMIHSNLTNENQNWEFRHPSFKRGAVDDLKNIKRKSAKSRHQSQSRMHLPTSQFSDADDYLYGPMYKRIVSTEERLHNALAAFEVLQNEATTLRNVISGQQEVSKERRCGIGEFHNLFDKEWMDGWILLDH